MRRVAVVCYISPMRRGAVVSAHIQLQAAAGVLQLTHRPVLSVPSAAVLPPLPHRQQAYGESGRVQHVCYGHRELAVPVRGQGRGVLAGADQEQNRTEQ